MTARVAAVTGGTGFLGRYVVAALVRAGWQVRMLARQDPTHPLLAGVPVEVVPGDLGDAAALSRLVRGASAVVHVAGLVKARRRQDFFTVNRDGSARLAAIAARDAPAARFVLVSSQVARMPAISPYAASKRAGETAAIAALGPAPWVVLRPCVIYGPWDYEGMLFLRMARRRLAPVPVSPEPRIAMIHARDAAEAIVAFAGGGPSGHVFELCDERPEGYSWSGILREAGNSFGQAPRFVPVPDLLIRASGMAHDGWAAISRRPVVFGLSKAREMLQRDWRSDPAQQPPAGLWKPRVDLASGLRETIAWWRER